MGRRGWWLFCLFVEWRHPEKCENGLYSIEEKQPPPIRSEGVMISNQIQHTWSHGRAPRRRRVVSRYRHGCLVAYCPTANSRCQRYLSRITVFRVPCDTIDTQDATGDAYTALGFSNGFQPRMPGDKKVNPYLRLLPMLAGIG